MACSLQTIKYIASMVPLNARIKLLHTLVVSRLNYAAVILNVTIENKEKLQKQLNWALRVVLIDDNSTLPILHKKQTY